LFLKYPNYTHQRVAERIRVDPNLGFHARDCFSIPLSFVLAPFSSIRPAQHLRPALSSMPIGKNLPFFHLLGLPQNA
jgi:hypothetical protein